MSLWFRGKNRQGRRYYYSVSIPWGLLLTVIVIILMLLLLWLRAWLHQ
jgi:hypothetical protein